MTTKTRRAMTPAEERVVKVRPANKDERRCSCYVCDDVTAWVFEFATCPNSTWIVRLCNKHFTDTADAVAAVVKERKGKRK